MRQDLLNKVLIFAAGATIGSVVTWAVMKSRYNYNREIETEVGEYLGVPEEDKSEESDTVKVDISEREPADEQTMIQYNKIVNDSGYSGVVEQKKEEDDVEGPYIIPAEEFEEVDGYNSVTLYWYEDKTLVDEMENEIDDPEDIIGYDALMYFEDYEDCDSVYVRNDARKTDYEILRG